MASHSAHANDGVVVHLLDSAQGQPLQSWRFERRDDISIGRGDDCDVVIVNPQVSRAHARLVLDAGRWTLFSAGRHGTIIDDRNVTEIVLLDQTVFQLGVGGPMLRFDIGSHQPRRSETIENIDVSLLSTLAVDDARKLQEVEQITGDALFRDLLEQSRQMRRSTKRSGELSPDKSPDSAVDHQERNA
jgi:hypothetical protein